MPAQLVTGELLIDHEPVAAGTLGAETLGAVLDRVGRGESLVTRVLIDGRAPDLDGPGLAAARATPLAGRCVYVETAHVAEAAADAALDAADALADTLPVPTDPAGLAGVFATWADAERATRQVLAATRLDPRRIAHGGRTLADVLDALAGQLRRVRGDLSAAAGPDFAGTVADWRGCLHAAADALAAVPPTDR